MDSELPPQELRSDLQPVNQDPTSQSLRVPPVHLGVRDPPPVPGRCLSCEEMRILRPPSTALDSFKDNSQKVRVEYGAENRNGRKSVYQSPMCPPSP